MAIKGFKDTDWMENIVEKGEIAHFEQFRLFRQCFPKVFFLNVLKRVYMEKSVKSSCDDKILDLSKFKAFLTLYQTIPTFNTPEKRSFLKNNCGKRRKCFLAAFSPFPTMFSTHSK